MSIISRQKMIILSEYIDELDDVYVRNVYNDMTYKFVITVVVYEATYHIVIIQMIIVVITAGSLMMMMTMSLKVHMMLHERLAKVAERILSLAF